MGRLPLHIEFGSTFTAQQWKNWTLYFFVMCLFDLLPIEHFRCWQSFVLACRCICQVSLSHTDITVADGLLLKFCKRCVELYGPFSITPNMHLHCHLANCIRDFGPSHAFWLFAFERYNGLLGNEPNNNRSVEIQLMQRFLKDNISLQLLSENEEKPCAEYFRNIVFNPIHYDHDDILEGDKTDACVLAKKSCLDQLTNEELQSLKLLYCERYPQLRSGLTSGALEIPSSFNKFSHAYIKTKKISSNAENAKQPYVAATPTVPFTVSEGSSCPVRAAEVLYFGKQFLSPSSTHPPITCLFVAVQWPKQYSSSLGRQLKYGIMILTRLQ